MAEHYLGDMRICEFRKIRSRRPAQVMHSEVRDLFVICLEHELHQVTADAHVETFTHRFIFILRENEPPRRQRDCPLQHRKHFRNDRANNWLFSFSACFVVFPRYGPDPFLKIKVCYFGLTEFPHPARPHQAQFIENFVPLNQSGILDSSPDKRHLFTV